MCLLNVANRGKYPATTHGGGDGDDEQDERYTQEVIESQLSHFRTGDETGSMNSTTAGYNRSTEMSAMVSALTHVVSGQRVADYWTSTSSTGGSGVSPVFSSSVFVGQKRNREEQSEAQLMESSLPRVYRGFGGFRTDSSSSSGAIICSYLQ